MYLFVTDKITSRRIYIFCLGNHSFSLNTKNSCKQFAACAAKHIVKEETGANTCTSDTMNNRKKYNYMTVCSI